MLGSPLFAPFVRLLPLLALLVLLGCGSSGGFDRQQADPDSTLHRGTVSLAQLLAELDALPTPAGANEADFAALKAALRTQLLEGQQQKFTAKAPSGQPNIVRDLTSDITELDEDAISWNYRNAGDYDLNSEVNISDLTPIGQNFQKTSASPDWATVRAVDGDGNGEINIADITPIGQNLLSQLASYRLESSDSVDGPWAEVSVFAFEDSAPRPGGRLFTYVLPDPRAPYYRVVPLDGAAAEGVPSDPSRSIQLSPLAEIVGSAGGVQFTSWDGTTLVLAAPSSDPTSIAVGDVVVGDDGSGGFMLRVLTVDQAGTVITITGSQASLADIVVKGTVDLSGAFAPQSVSSAKWVNQAPGLKQVSAPYPFSCDCVDQIVHTGGGLDLNVVTMNLDFAPDALVKVNYRDSQVTYFKSELVSDHYTFNAHLVLSGANFNGSFPADANDRVNYELAELDVTYSLSSLVDELPVAGQTTLRLYLGVEGEGNFQGNYETTLNSNYTDLQIGSVYRPSTGWVDVKTYTPNYENPPTPLISSGGGDVPQLRVYLRGEMLPTLYKYVDENNDPLPLATIGFTPSSHLNATDTSTPSDGFDYVVSGGFTGSLDVNLSPLGLGNETLSRSYDDSPTVVKSGFVPDGGPTGFLISGNITEDTTADGIGDGPLANVVVNLLDGSDVQIAQDVTDVAGDYSFSDVASGQDVKIEPVLASYAFNPLNITFTVGGDSSGNDFVGSQDTSDKTISGNISDGINGIAGITVGGEITGSPGILWMDVTDANGDYQLAGISAGFDVTVIPDPLSASVYSFSPPTLQYIMNADVTGADFTATAVTTWQHSVGLNFVPTDEGVNAVTSDAAGNLYAAGYSETSAGGAHAGMLAKYDENGVLQWCKLQFPEFTYSVDFNAVAVDANGIYTVGTFGNFNTSNEEIVVMRWAANGDITWLKSWGIGASSKGYAAELDSNGDLYVGGECNNGGLTGQDAAFIKYDKDGNILWQKSYQVAGTDFVRGGAFEASLGFLVSGHATNTLPTSSEDISLLTVASDGTLGVDALYDIGDLYNAGLDTVAVAGNGIFVCGSTVAADNLSSEALCFKTAPDGTFLVSTYWANSDPNDTFNQFNSVVVSGTELHAAGYWNDASAPRLNAAIASFDLSLVHQASEAFNGSGATRLYGSAVHAASGDIFLGGYGLDASGSWNSVIADLSAPAVIKSPYGGSLVVVNGTVNPPLPNPSDGIVAQDSGGGLKEALVFRH